MDFAGGGVLNARATGPPPDTTGSSRVVTKARTIEVAPGSELARLLDDPAGLPVDLLKDGRRYRLSVVAGAGTGRAPEADEDSRLEDARRTPRKSEEPLADAGLGEGWEGYDPERVRQVLDEVAGTLSDEEADRWIEEIYRARRLVLQPHIGMRAAGASPRR